MHKLEQEMIRAIRNRKNWKKDNTQVQCWSTHLDVYLYGNLIAVYYYNAEQENLRLFDGGWQTLTTKSRLNAICNAFRIGGIYQKDFTWYQVDTPDDKRWVSGTWYTV